MMLHRECAPSMMWQVASEHDRLTSELLSVLVSAGFLGPADAAGRFVTTDNVSSPETAAELARLKATSDELASAVVPDLASNVRLIWVCMQAVPEILKGARSFGPPLASAASTGGSIKCDNCRCRECVVDPD